MDWTEETISRLRSLWQEGLSTAEIGRRMSITKNAVVGKAHRLTLPARPSPIRKGLMPGDAEPRHAAPRAPRVAAFVPRPLMQPVRARSGTANGGSGEALRMGPQNRTAATNVTPLRAAEPAKPDPTQGYASAPAASDARAAAVPPLSRPISQPAPRRYGQSCCWPLGEPGTKQFHFCGSEPIPGKPYCSEHAQLAYVKLRDRRDTVA